MIQSNDVISDKIAGLKLGANDYLSKPFDLEELLLRVQMAQRHTRLVIKLMVRQP